VLLCGVTTCYAIEGAWFQRLQVQRDELVTTFACVTLRRYKQGWSAKLIMVDTDIVIVGSVQELFDDTPEFDYGLSIRASNPYPAGWCRLNR